MNTQKGILFFSALAAAALLVGFASGGGAKLDLDPESAKFFETARLVMTGEELKIFKRLPDAASRKEFIRDFWDKRDPDPDTEENEFKKEFESRVEYVGKRFNKEGGPGYNTDRGRIYIFMGPPDKFEEFMTHEDETVKGPILWWIYYDYQLGIEFVDEKGYGQYKIRKYDGDFFGAMDIIKLGQWVGTDEVFRKKIVNFSLKYDSARKEIEISLPVNSVRFRENDEGRDEIDLSFSFYIYGDKGLTKDTYAETKSFVTSQQEFEDLKSIPFRFSYALKPGTNFVDVIIKGREGTRSKIRKIFEVKAS